MFCPNCASKIEDNQNFCAHCGHSFEDWNDPAHLQKEQKRKNPKIWFYIIFLVALGLTFWGFHTLFFSSNDLETVAKAQLNEIQKNQITKAYYEYSSSQFKNQISLDAFRNFINQNSGLKEFNSVVFHDIQKENNYGVAFGDLTAYNGTIIPIKYEFIKEDGDWRVLKIDLEEAQIAHSDLTSTDEAIITSVSNQLQAIRLGNIKNAYELYGSKDFKSKTELPLFEQFINHYPNLTLFDNIELTGFDQTKNKAKINLILFHQGKPLNLEYSLINENGVWKIWSMQVISNPESDEAIKGISESVKKFVNTLNDNEIRQAYESTSPKFKESTSLEKFQSFISKFPRLKNKEITILQTTQEKKLGLARVQSNLAGENFLIDYTLAKDGNIWKVLGIEIVNEGIAKPVTEKTEPEFDKSFLVKVIDDQLDKIRDNDLRSAYEKYTSEEFREATSFEIFSRFISQNSIYSNNLSGEFKDLSFDNNVATIKGLLQSSKGEQGIVEYDLIKEKDSWKILGIKILSTQKESTEK